MKKPSYVLFTTIQIIYFFLCASILNAFDQYTARTYSNALLLQVNAPAMLFAGYGALTFWKCTSKCTKSIDRKGLITLCIAAILFQIIIIAVITSGIISLKAMMFMNTKPILMIYTSLGFDIGMLFYGIRRPN